MDDLSVGVGWKTTLRLLPDEVTETEDQNAHAGELHRAC